MKLTKAERVKIALENGGEEGVSNWDLNRITFRYGAVIHDLRKDGYTIETKQIGNDGLYRYIWKGWTT